MMSREDMLSALADAGYPVELITDEMPDEDLQKIVQFVVGEGGDDEGEGDDDGLEFDDDEDLADEDLEGLADEDDDLNFMDDEDLDLMGDDEEDDEEDDPAKMSSKPGGRTPTKVTTTQHFRDKGKKVLTFSEAKKLIQQAVTQAVAKAVPEAVKASVNRRTQVVKFSEQIDSFLDAQVKEGRVLPSAKAVFRNSLMDAARSGKKSKDGKKTALKARMDEIASMPKILHFAESVDDGGRITAHGANGPMDPARKEQLLRANGQSALGEIALQKITLAK